MPRRNRNRKRRSNGTTVRRISRKRQRQDVGVGTIRQRVSGHQIPQHTNCPKVQRYVRLSGQLTPSAPGLLVTPDLISVRDALDYLGSPSVLRYQYVRVIGIRAWLETPAATLASPSFGIAITDAASGTQYITRAIYGSTYAALAMQLCLETRSVVYPAADNTTLINVETDITIPSGGLYYVCDVLSEFT